MKPNIQKQIRKQFFIKSYRNLWQLEEAIKTVRANFPERVGVSVLGKLVPGCFLNDREIIKAKEELRTYWKESLSSTSDFGLFCNPEIGTLFIVGSLASQFLNNVDGKILGEMASGPYGILRGLGIAENKASIYIKDLNEKYFLLILRGYDNELDIMEELLENLK